MPRQDCRQISPGTAHRLILHLLQDERDAQHFAVCRVLLHGAQLGQRQLNTVGGAQVIGVRQHVRPGSEQGQCARQHLARLLCQGAGEEGGWG